MRDIFRKYWCCARGVTCGRLERPDAVGCAESGPRVRPAGSVGARGGLPGQGAGIRRFICMRKIPGAAHGPDPWAGLRAIATAVFAGSGPRIRSAGSGGGVVGLRGRAVAAAVRELHSSPSLREPLPQPLPSRGRGAQELRVLLGEEKSPGLPTGVTRGPGGEPLRLRCLPGVARGSGPRAAPVQAGSLISARLAVRPRRGIGAGSGW